MERIKELARAVLFTLTGYRPQQVSGETWDREYRDGQWEYLRKMDSLAGLASILATQSLQRLLSTSTFG